MLIEQVKHKQAEAFDYKGPGHTSLVRGLGFSSGYTLFLSLGRTLIKGIGTPSYDGPISNRRPDTTWNNT